MNSKGSRILGIIKDVLIKVGGWKGKLDFTIIKMDDYEVILGIEFMIEKEVVLVPHFG